MVYLLYDVILLASAVVLIPYYLLRGAKYGKVRRGIRERLGFFAPDRLTALQGRKVLWIHAVSVGETRAAIPLIKALKEAYPDHVLVLSNVTETGYQIAGNLKGIDLRLFFPFDLSFVARRVLRQIGPSMIIIVETEIWPNFVRIARQMDIPVVLANGRISDRSFPRYRMIRPLLRPILNDFSAFCMQTCIDAERIRDLGGPPDRLSVTGNLKFDIQATLPDPAAIQSFRAGFHLPEGVLIWVAGSTHSGEEEAVLDIYRNLIAAGIPLVLVLVPRHPERCRGVGEMLSGHKVRFVLRSRIAANEDPLRPGEVLLVDTVGEMLNLYALADLVFVGGSLVPIGGHNILEASLLKKPVLFGPHMHNFKEISRMVQEAGGGICGRDALHLQEEAFRLLADEPLRRQMGEAGYALLRKNAGATAETLAVIRRVMGD
jgi:3-deoxy-D-manno-octulosonic-acid transferase